MNTCWHKFKRKKAKQGRRRVKQGAILGINNGCDKMELYIGTVNNSK